MAVSLIDRRIGGEKVIVGFPIHIPHFGATPFAKHHRERMIVVGSVFLFQVDHRLLSAGERHCPTMSDTRAQKAACLPRQKPKGSTSERTTNLHQDPIPRGKPSHSHRATAWEGLLTFGSLRPFWLLIWSRNLVQDCNGVRRLYRSCRNHRCKAIFILNS